MNARYQEEAWLLNVFPFNEKGRLNNRLTGYSKKDQAKDETRPTLKFD